MRKGTVGEGGQWKGNERQRTPFMDPRYAFDS